MLKYIFYLLLVIVAFPAFSQPSEEIRQRIEWIERYDDLQIEKISITAKKGIKDFYYSRMFEPAWTEKEAIEDLLSALSKAGEEGLYSFDYHHARLDSFYIKYQQGKFLQADIDILFTQAFLIYGSHLLHGKVDPKTTDAAWKIQKKEKDITVILEQAIKSNTVYESLIDLNPNITTYIRLKDYLRLYRQNIDKYNWDPLHGGEVLKPGMKDNRIPAIAKRLVATGDLKSHYSSKDSIYNEELKIAVMQLQKRHGLTPDGSIGEKTIGALNISYEDRIKKVIINMERCRWLPEELGAKYILVNIPAFQLRYVVRKELVKEMNVVVGKPYRQTPVFSSSMTYMVFNPYWFVPLTILREDMIPAMRKNPSHLNNLNIKVLKGNEVIASNSIDWKEVKASSFPYKLRQEPGPNNALGVVKFMFPNKYNVYLHDTNNRNLFNQEDRDLSSGCIRVSEPLVLAQLILEDQGEWSLERINKSIEKEKNYTVRIKQPVAVHFQYWTAYTDVKGHINFRKDIYNRDENIWKALNVAP